MPEQQTGLPENITTVPQLPPPKKKFGWGRVALYLFRAFLSLLLLFFVLIIVLQIPVVQQKIVNYTSTYLSKKLNTKVKIDEFKVNFVGDLIINGLYVGNQFAPNDTLFSVEKLDAGINPAYIPLGIYQLNHLNLSDVVVRIKHEEGQKEDNIAFIDKFLNPDKDKKDKKPQSPLPDVRVALINMHNIEFDNNDEIEGRRMTVYLNDLKLETNFMNLPRKNVDIANIMVQKPQVFVQETEPHPLPESNQQTKKDTSSLKDISTAVVQTSKFRFSIGAVNIVDGRFNLDKWHRSEQRHPFAHTIDFDHLNVVDADIFLHNWIYFNEEWSGTIDGIHAVEGNGFELKKLTSDNVRVTSTMTEFAGVRIETPYSIVGDTFRMMYSDPSAFRDYDNLITMEAKIKSPKIMLDDIMAFAPDLEINPFFQKNRKEIAVVDATIIGTVNTLKVIPFSVKIGDGFTATGKFSSRDLKNKDETFISLGLTDLKTSIASLRQLVPDFKPGDNYNKLGNLSFNGNFDGFFNDFTTSGNLTTDLGGAVMDMTLKPFGDNNKTTYTGNLSLVNFDLGKFTEDNNLGKVSLKTTITNGTGFKKENVVLDFHNTINDFSYKNYAYKNLSATGHYENKKFVGKFESKDENADFLFDGTVDIASPQPVFRFKTNVNRIDLKTLGFIPDDIVVGGELDINLTGDKLSNIIGTINTDNIEIVKNKNEKYLIDSLNISSSINDNIKTYSLGSNLLKAKIEGQLNLENIVDAFKSNIYHFHPGIATDLKLLPNNLNLLATGLQNLNASDAFNFDIHVLDTKNLTFLFDKKLGAIKKLDINGTIDNVKGNLDWDD